MAKTFTITNQEWTKIAPGSGENSDLVLSTSTSRQVWHSSGSQRNPVVFKQLSADPAHPFTAGQLQVVFSTEDTIFGTRDVVHSANFNHGLFYDELQDAAGTVEQGGLYLGNYRVPLEFLIQLYTQPNPAKKFLQINCVRPDVREIDADDRTGATLTIDPDIDETVTDIALTNGTSTPSVEGGVELKWELTDAQYASLKPDNGATPPVREYNKIGLTIASTSSVAPITYSAYSELHPKAYEGEFQLKLGEDRGMKAPSSGAWYARLRYPNAAGGPDSAIVSVGE